MIRLVPVLVTAGLFATSCTAAALFTGMDTVFWVAGLIAIVCVVASVCILEHAERARIRAEKARHAEYRAAVWARRILAGDR